MSVFLEVLKSFGIFAGSSHAFSCEWVEFKQEFLGHVWELEHIFKDALEMSDDRVHCYNTAAKVEVLEVDVPFSDTSCKDFSAQNCKAQSGFFAADDWRVESDARGGAVVCAQEAPQGCHT